MLLAVFRIYRGSLSPWHTTSSEISRCEADENGRWELRLMNSSKLVALQNLFKWRTSIMTTEEKSAWVRPIYTNRLFDQTILSLFCSALSSTWLSWLSWKSTLDPLMILENLSFLKQSIFIVRCVGDYFTFPFWLSKLLCRQSSHAAERVDGIMVRPRLLSKLASGN